MGRSTSPRAPLAAVVRPIGHVWRLRAWMTLDVLVTLALTGLAVALAVAYQVVGRWARRSGA